MSKTTFKPNSAGFREMAVGEELRRATLEVAEKAKVDGISLAQDFRVTGDYADSFEATSETVKLRTSFGEHEVAAGVLTNRSEHAAAVEWGNARDHRPHRVLGRVLDELNHG